MHIPLLVNKTSVDIETQVNSGIAMHTGNALNGDDDIRAAIVRIFSRMMGRVVDRLNQAPLKNQEVFLNLIGARCTPARSARVPVSFEVAKNLDPSSSVTVPEFTSIAAVPIIGAKDAVLFETESPFAAIRASVTTLIVYIPNAPKMNAYFIAPGNPIMDPFPAFAVNNAAGLVSTVIPEPAAESFPTLYIGFDQPLPSTVPITLFMFAVDPSIINPDILLQTQIDALAVTWEALVANQGSGGVWRRITVSDDTNNLTREGTVGFMAPPAMLPRPTAPDAKSRYWIRATMAANAFGIMPMLRGAATNTTWARQAITVRNETLGSSNGSSTQNFFTCKSPILDEFELRVFDPALSDQFAGNTALRQNGSWRTWTEVCDFFASGPDDEHYTLNRQTGEIVFGDGRFGRVPQASRHNIQALFYRTGGGVQGNCLSGTVRQLKTTIPYVKKAVNYIDAAGGSDQEDHESVRNRAPRIFRHRYRAVTVEDFEDLAKEASPLVARALAVSPEYDPLRWRKPRIVNPANGATIDTGMVRGPGEVLVLIVPALTEFMPVPAMELRRQVETYLKKRCEATASFRVLSPQYWPVKIRAIITASGCCAAADLDMRIRATLHRFLHPLTGASDRNGWNFGRRPYASDLYRELESIDGVDIVRWIDVDTSRMPDVTDDDPHVTRALALNALIFSPPDGDPFTHDINIELQGRASS